MGGGTEDGEGTWFCGAKKASVLSSTYGALRKRAKLWVDVGKNGSPKLKTHRMRHHERRRMQLQHELLNSY